MKALKAVLQKVHQPKFIFFLFFAILVGPFLAAYLLIQKPADVFRLNNHGDLITPPQDISALSFYDPQKNEPFKGQDLNGKWWLMYVAPLKCQQTCHNILYNMRQIRSALGKDATRLERLFIAHPSCPNSVCEQYLTENYPDMRKAQLKEGAFENLFNAISHKNDRETFGELYIIDPKGNIMMHYGADMDSRAILSDLKRLLKVSKIG